MTDYYAVKKPVPVEVVNPDTSDAPATLAKLRKFYDYCV